MQVDYEFENGAWATLDVPAVPRVGDTVFWMAEADEAGRMVPADSEWLVGAVRQTTVEGVMWLSGPSATGDPVATVTLVAHPGSD